MTALVSTMAVQEPSREACAVCGDPVLCMIVDAKHETSDGAKCQTQVSGSPDDTAVRTSV